MQNSQDDYLFITNFMNGEEREWRKRELSSAVDPTKTPELRERRAALELGRWTFPAPLGYLNAPKWSGKSLVYDPDPAAVVKRAFEDLATGQYTRTAVTAPLFNYLAPDQSAEENVACQP